MNESRETQSLQTGILPGEAGFKKVYPIFVLLCLTFLTGLKNFFAMAHIKND